MKHRTLVCIIVALAGLTAPNLVMRAQAADANAPGNTPPSPAEGVTVTGTQEKIINEFVYSYAAPTNTLIGQLARWNIAICPATTGLSPAFNKFVTARVKEVAAEIGAKLETKNPCKPNLQIIVTPRPQVLMDAVRKKAAWLLGSHYKAEEKDLATVSHPIQAWYVTGTADKKGTLVPDDIGDISLQCDFDVHVLSGQYRGAAGSSIPVSSCNDVRGSRVDEGWHSEFAVVTVVVDINKIADIEIGAVADYAAMLGLSQTKVSDTCQPLPTITNLFAPDCDAAHKATALTAYDTAYLTGLYQMNNGLTASLQKADLAAWMKIKLKSPK